MLVFYGNRMPESSIKKLGIFEVFRIFSEDELLMMKQLFQRLLGRFTG